MVEGLNQDNHYGRENFTYSVSSLLVSQLNFYSYLQYQEVFIFYQIRRLQ